MSDATPYVLIGGPYEGETRHHESSTLEVVAPRWPAPGVTESATTYIRIAHGRYTHTGSEFVWRDNIRFRGMQWRGFDS